MPIKHPELPIAFKKGESAKYLCISMNLKNIDMKTIKSFLVISILFLSTSIFAQPPGGGQRGGQQGPPTIPNDKQIEKMVSDLADALTLSNEQEAEILELYKAHFTQVKEKTSGKSRPDREEMDSLKLAFEKQVKAELSKEQATKYEAYLKKQQPQKRK